ncbi:acyltransferase [Brachybacterium sp. Z12]|uniref:acyltransferase family protein n=1 Tax=Brachybacterium sp. Z12 TaxID=2759167 RepID=UPI00292A563B|nr:acyltransferase [Brachybacterium sp. Z12]
MPPRRLHRTFTSALSSQDNALNLVRLTLAILVIFGHVFSLAGLQTFEAGPLKHAGWHGAAVHGFFAISGFLILASAIKTPLAPYLWRRFLRIYPGYFVAILAIAFLFAPLGALLDASVRWDGTAAVRFVIGSLDLRPSAYPVENAVPWQQGWNGSLWTLFYEGVAYVGLGLATAIPWVRRNIRVLAPVIGVLGTIGYLGPSRARIATVLPDDLARIVHNGLELWTFFAWGMVAYVFADRLRPHLGWIAASSGVALVALSVPAIPTRLSELVLLPAITYTVLAAGALIPWRLGARNDISYGVYVYAFPVQQILVILGVGQFGWLVTALSCLVCTIPLAWASWKLVEQPSMRLRRVVPSRRRAEPIPQSA